MKFVNPVVSDSFPIFPFSLKVGKITVSPPFEVGVAATGLIKRHKSLFCGRGG
jgi:hypothetical protein